MSEDQKNPPAQPEFGELAPEGWSWNPEANAPHTPETLKAAEAAAKAAAKTKAASTATSAKVASAPTANQTPDISQKPGKLPKPVGGAKPPKPPKAIAAIFGSPPSADSNQNLSEEEKKTRTVALAKLASDRFITWGLLGVAVFSIVSGLGDYVNLTRTLNAAFDQLNTMEPGLNLAPYANMGLAKILGWGIVFSQAIVIGLTFWWAIRRMRAGKMAFWVPVVGFAISSAVVLGFMVFAFVADPTAWNAILTYIQNTSATKTPGQNS
ncbi:hypothetical protein GCM10027022_03030 [Alpinimonas psychrophila]|uniref:Uncharacterized protein n=1 Tax=Alpinimonas psychrophila TaxID=748908 RepID=A0A7W3JRZ3_9MICO|nr:DUF6264 family protein [Alpinimonas psychrophila]MBA8828115.1 hypothetical protein [Alpinimonas psychrophila]